MYKRSIDIPTAIHLIMSGKVEQKLFDNRGRYAHLPSRAEILSDFQQLGLNQGVPATIKVHEGQARLHLYTTSYFIECLPSRQNDGYVISYVEPLNLREHELLSKGVLMLRARFWEMHLELREIPSGNKNYWEYIYQAWQHVEAQRRQQNAETASAHEELTPLHSNFLNTIDMLVEVTHRLEQDTNKLAPPIPYRSVESTGEERYARDIYTFILEGSPQLNEKTILRIKEKPDLQGRILARKDNRLTVKFESAIDRTGIPNRGNFEPIISKAIYRTQKEAIDTIRQGETKNKHLLHVFVDRIYQPYQHEPASPREKLNEAQLQAFQHALTVPDMLLVLGPPGTGKTRTITEIARHCSTRRQRVLVTSKTHKAVDNVLERLPSDLMVVRFGHEDRVSESIRPKLIDEQTKAMQQYILEQTEPSNRQLANFLQHKGTIDQWLQLLTAQGDQIAQIEQSMADTERLCSIEFQRVATPYQPDLDALTTTLQRQKAQLAQQHEKITTWTERLRKAEVRSQESFFGFLFQWLASMYRSRLQRATQASAEQQALHATTQQEYSSLHGTLQQALTHDAAYQRYNTNLRRLKSQIANLQKQALTQVNTLQGTIQGLFSVSDPPETLSASMIQDYLSWFSRSRSLVENRAKLLQDWRSDLTSRTEQMKPELLRCADVVGATCIGVATTGDLADVEFDLAIVDEAGQIAIPDLLVPLVRARRTVLVGDHHQLPPFMNNEVETWLNTLPPQTAQELGLIDPETDSERVTNLLSRSAFEQLFTGRVDRHHMIPFTEQHRMPRMIADFASMHFYNSQLRTPAERNAAPNKMVISQFRHPLVLIDTSSLPPDQRKETRCNASEGLGITGYINEAEARLIARLAALYEREDHDEQEWVVIVPYRAQAQRIIQLLRKREDMQHLLLEQRVSTVDSFQGGERNHIIYGFTRSNEHGKIGFLDELRRLNVAITRAKQQLVLIGDLATLTRADDVAFRTVALSLQAYTRQHGTSLTYKDCWNSLPMQPA